MEKLLMGKTGEKLSIIGLSGVIIMHEEQKIISRYVSMAIDRRINYFNVAPLYENAQQLLGPALELYRNNSFLACMTLPLKTSPSEGPQNSINTINKKPQI